MATTAGAVSVVSVGANKATVMSAPATGGATTPYTYQWYKSQTTGFVPGTGNIIPGATSLTLNDSGLTPTSKYYYKMVSADSSATPVTATSAQLAVATSALQPNQNQFAETPFLGQLDLKFNPDTISCEVDAAETGILVAGAAVKFATTPGGLPKVLKCIAASDVACGFVNYDIKSKQYVAGDKLEISMKGNVMFLLAVAAINRGVQVTSLPEDAVGGANGGVITAAGSGLQKVGFALDTIPQGQLGRIFIEAPSFSVT